MKRVELEAVGAPSSPGAVLTGRRWQGVIFFRPWRVVGEPVSKALLRVVLPARVSSSQAMRECRRVKEGVVYRFEVDLEPRSPNTLDSGELRSALRRIKGETSLAAADAEVARTVRVNDRVLGKLVRQAREELYRGHVKVLGRRCPLFVMPPIDRAAQLFARANHAVPGVPRAIVRKLLRLANDSWLEEGAQPLTEAQFLKRLKPTDVWLDGKSLQLSFDCGDTFADHGVTATVTRAGAIRRIQLQ